MPTNAFRRHCGRAVLAASVAGALAVTACGDPSSGTAPDTGAPSPAIQQALDSLVGGGFPGAQAVISGPGGTRTFTAGAGDLATGAPMPEHAQVRIGSNTKTFVATVVLQLVAEHRVELDAPVERYLPGVVHGNGNDGNRITVRQLLQHTSGLQDYLGSGAPGAKNQVVQLNPDLESVRWQRYDAAQLVSIAMSMPPQFEPGARSVYTNTNYVLLGMLIDRVTGQSYQAEITRRIIEPLGLRATYFPAPGETGIRDPHPAGYREADGKRSDATEQNVTWADAAGDMVSTGAELNRFFTALLSGELLQEAELAEMKRTVPIDRIPGGGYGLGLIRQPSSCGKEIWGHGGSIPGFETRTGVTTDKKAIIVTVNQLPTSEAQYAVAERAFDAVVCAA